MFKNFNNILLKRKIVLLLRIVLMMILINHLLSTAVQKQDAVIFFKRELISIFSYNDYSEVNLEIPKRNPQTLVKPFAFHGRMALCHFT